MYVCILVYTWLRPREMKTVLAHLQNYLLFFFHFSPIDFLKSVNIVIGDIMRGVILEKFSGCEFHLLGTRIHLNEITRELGKFVKLMNWDVTYSSVTMPITNDVSFFLLFFSAFII